MIVAFEERFDDLARVLALRRKEEAEALAAIAVVQRAYGHAAMAYKVAQKAFDDLVTEHAALVNERDARTLS